MRLHCVKSVDFIDTFNYKVSAEKNAACRTAAADKILIYPVLQSCQFYERYTVTLVKSCLYFLPMQRGKTGKRKF